MISLRRLKKATVRYGRYSGAGRVLLGTATFAAQPMEYFDRRRVAAAYNAQFPRHDMSETGAYAVLPAGTVPGTSDTLALCRRLFAVKKAELEADAPSARKLARNKHRKTSFQRDLLTNDDLRANPALVDFALSDSVLSLVTNYLGIVPHLTRVDLVYSIPRDASDGFIASQLFHQDPEGLRQVKIYINVFEITERDGPFIFIPAAETTRVVAAVRDERKRKGKDDPARFQDEELAAQGGLESVISVTGPAGTFMAVDTTRCLHAGSRLEEPGRQRLMFFLQYCTSMEKSHLFDAERYRNDPIRWLALKRHQG